MVDFTLSSRGWSEFWGGLVESVKEFFNPKLDGYTNFDFGSDSIINIHIIVFGIFIGVMLAAAYSIYTKKILGKFVRKLISEDAFSPESAKTLGELGFGKNFAIKQGLRGYTLGRVVNSVEKDAYLEEVRTMRGNYESNRKAAHKHGKWLPAFNEPKFGKTVDQCRYYIAEKNRYTAEMRFNANGSGYGTFFFVLLIAVMCIIIIYAILPHLLAFTDAALSDFTVKGNIFTPEGSIIK